MHTGQYAVFLSLFSLLSPKFCTLPIIILQGNTDQEWLLRKASLTAHLGGFCAQFAWGLVHPKPLSHFLLCLSLIMATALNALQVAYGYKLIELDLQMATFLCFLEHCFMVPIFQYGNLFILNSKKSQSRFRMLAWCGVMGLALLVVILGPSVFDFLPYVAAKSAPPLFLCYLLLTRKAPGRTESNIAVTNNNIEEATQLMHDSKKSTKTEDNIQAGQRDMLSRIYDTVINHIFSRSEKEQVESALRGEKAGKSDTHEAMMAAAQGLDLEDGPDTDGGMKAMLKHNASLYGALGFCAMLMVGNSGEAIMDATVGLEWRDALVKGNLRVPISCFLATLLANLVAYVWEFIGGKTSDNSKSSNNNKRFHIYMYLWAASQVLRVFLLPYIGNGSVIWFLVLMDKFTGQLGLAAIEMASLHMLRSDIKKKSKGGVSVVYLAAFNSVVNQIMRNMMALFVIAYRKDQMTLVSNIALGLTVIQTVITIRQLPTGEIKNHND